MHWSIMCFFTIIYVVSCKGLLIFSNKTKQYTFIGIPSVLRQTTKAILTKTVRLACLTIAIEMFRHPLVQFSKKNRNTI